MGKNFKEKTLYNYNHDLPTDPKWLLRIKLKFLRNNGERGEDRYKRQLLKEKIFNNNFKKELNEF